MLRINKRTESTIRAATNVKFSIRILGCLNKRMPNNLVILKFMQKLQNSSIYYHIVDTLFLKFVKVMVAVHNQIKITEQVLFLRTKLVIKAISSVHTCNALLNEYPNGILVSRYQNCNKYPNI